MVLIMSRIASSSAADKAALTGGASKAQGAAADRETLCGPDPGPQSIGLLGGKDGGVKPQGRGAPARRTRTRFPVGTHGNGCYAPQTGDNRSSAAISPNPKLLSVASKAGVSRRPDVKIARGGTGSIARA